MGALRFLTRPYSLRCRHGNKLCRMMVFLVAFCSKVQTTEGSFDFLSGQYGTTTTNRPSEATDTDWHFQGDKTTTHKYAASRKEDLHEEYAVQSASFCTKSPQTNDAVITCKKGRSVADQRHAMLIKLAYYGVNIASECSPSAMDCFEDSTFDPIVSACMSKQSCNIKLQQRHLASCKRNSTYLHIRYMCLPVEAQIHNICSTIQGQFLSSGFFTSPGYPGDYPPNSSCTCQFKAEAHQMFHFRLLDVRMERSYDCNFDHVGIITKQPGNNHDVKRFCDSSERLRYLVVSSSTVNVTFYADAYVENAGFWLIYYVVPKDNRYTHLSRNISISCKGTTAPTTPSPVMTTLSTTTTEPSTTLAITTKSPTKLPNEPSLSPTISPSETPMTSQVVSVKNTMTGKPTRNQTDTQSSRPRSPDIGLIVGVVIAILIGIAFGNVVGIYIFRRKFKAGTCQQQWSSNMRLQPSAPPLSSIDVTPKSPIPPPLPKRPTMKGAVHDAYEVPVARAIEEDRYTKEPRKEAEKPEADEENIYDVIPFEENNYIECI